MQVILLVVVGAISQSKYVPMMSLAVVGTLTNQILLVYAGLRGSMQGSTWGSTWVYIIVLHHLFDNCTDYKFIFGHIL